MIKAVSNPTSTGGAGAQFEAKVAASYLLALLANMPGRGLPGVVLKEVRAQQAPDGAPLDDIVLTGADANGGPAQLDIQVKHKVSFSPSDGAFKSVCEGIGRTVQQLGFYDRNHLMAIALARTSTKIEGPYQDVLTWARELPSAEMFFSRLDIKNVASEPMRTFVATFRAHLTSAGAPADDEDIWKALRRLLILPYDFAATGSTALDLVLERSSRCLADGAADRHAALWDSLVERARQMASVGGATTCAELQSHCRDLGYPLSGNRAYAGAMLAVEDCARLALNRIDGVIGDVSLARQSRIDSVRGAFETARYVEIQGDAGVGKSGLLKHFGRQQSEQGRVLVLSPGGVTPRGWTQMRSALGFDGTCRDLLRELVLEGEAYVLIDNIDRFSADEQTTVIDILGEAACIPAIKILATGRRPIEPDAPRWLSASRLKDFQPGPPVLIEALSDDELHELRDAAPALAPLLHDDHPARAVARNLFRLSRLATRPKGEEVPHTEVEMMRDWWTSGDGGDPSDETDIRERRRLLAALGSHAARTDAPFDSSDCEARPVQRLINQRTLVEYGTDRIDFFHDVLREWAMAMLLIEAEDPGDVFDVSARATPVQARAVELACAHTFSADPTGAAWSKLLVKLGVGGAPSTWRRAGLLSASRAEAYEGLPPAVEACILDEDAAKLRELIRLVRAIEVMPGKEVMVKAGLETAAGLPDFDMPAGPSWLRLIRWTAANMSRISPKAYIEISKLYADWCLAFLGHAPFQTVLVNWQHWWLEQIETAREAERIKDIRRPFAGALSHKEVDELEESARMAFLPLAAASPDKIKTYLVALQTRRRADKAIDWVMKFSKAIARVAPKELSALTCNYLFAEEPGEDDTGWGGYPSRDAFRHVDTQFMPESPAQGPFLPLLEFHPETGLALVRKVIFHAADRLGREGAPEAFTIEWNGKPFHFTHLFTYGWTGPNTAGYALTSALWALEYWGHSRLEAGENPHLVLSDIIGAPGAPAAFACVAVHLVISNLERCQLAGAPFFGCPELLSIDMERPVRQMVSGLDLFGGFPSVEIEIAKTAREALMAKPSRGQSLMDQIGRIAIAGDDAARTAIRSFLERARDRLPAVTPEDSLRSPSLMTQHALNQLDRENWIPEEQGDRTGLRYRSPPDEQAHFEQLNAARGEQMSDDQLRLAATLAAREPNMSSSDLAARAVAIAQRDEASAQTEEDEDAWLASEAVVSAAMIAMRDGDADLKREQRDWARGIFAPILDEQEGRSHLFSIGRAGTAFLGLAFSLSSPPSRNECALVLRARFSPHDMQQDEAEAALKALHARDPRLVRAHIRCRIQSRIYAVRSWEIGDDKREQDVAELEHRLDSAIEAELYWMFEGAAEPVWPELPVPHVRVRRGIRIGKRRAFEDENDWKTQPARRFDFDADHAAVWINAARSALPPENRTWLYDLGNAYAEWTFAANGADRDLDERLEPGPDGWSREIAAIAAEGFDPETRTSRIENFTERLINLSDARFLTLMSDYLLGLDVRYFETQEQAASGFVAERGRLADRLLVSGDLSGLVSRRRPSISFELGPALGRLFFASHNISKPPTCYLDEAAIERAAPFLPMMTECARLSPSYFSAFAILSFAELAPRIEHLELMLTAAETWRAHFNDETEFWIGQGIGRRLIAYFRTMLELSEQDSFDDQTLAIVDRIIAHLVSLGLSDAAQFENERSSQWT